VASTSTPTPTPASTWTSAVAEVEINYYVIEESNCDRQRSGEPLTMAANRFRTHSPRDLYISFRSRLQVDFAAYAFISHTLCSLRPSGLFSSLLYFFPRNWQFAKQKTLFSCYCYRPSSIYTYVYITGIARVFICIQMHFRPLSYDC